MKNKYFKTSVLTHLFPLRGLVGFFILLFFPLFLTAQQDWQWGVRGGSNVTYTGGQPFETVIDMAVDKNGNSYLVSEVGDWNFNVEGVEHQFHTPTNFEARSVVIASFNCDGAYRWSKLISGRSHVTVKAIRTDTLGNVYVTGRIPYGSYNAATQEEMLTHFDTDTIIPYSADPNTYKKRTFLVRYDDLGNFEQLIMPEPDNVHQSDATSHYGAIDLAVDPDGTVHWWVQMTLDQGGFLEGEAVPVGNYILKYDIQGNYTGRVNLDMNTHNTTHRLQMSHDPITDSYFFTGRNSAVNSSESFYVGGEEVISSMFVAKLNGQGGFEWLKQAEDNLDTGYFFGRPILDSQGNIYLSGYMYVIGGGPAEFNGYIAENTLGNGAFPVALKLDTGGNLLWGTHGESEGGGINDTFITINGQEAVVASLQTGISWGSEYFPYVPNTGYDIFIARFNKEDGSFIDMENLESNSGFTEIPTGIASDYRGNVYVGGNFTSQLIINDNQTLYKNGGSSDFFVAKYGQDNCDCTLPEASFSYSGSGNGTVNLNFNGSGFNELEWGLGDGTSQTAPGNISYTYNSGGTFWVCVTAYNDCGNDSWCMEVDPHTMGVEELSSEQFTYFPNPVQNHLNIEAKEDLSYQLFSMAGRQLQTGQLPKGSNKIDFENLAKGVYMLKLQNQKGQTTTVKVVRE